MNGGAQDLPVRDDAPDVVPAHSLADEHIFGHIRLGPSSTWICGVCEDAGKQVGVVFRYNPGGPPWTHVGDHQ